MSQDHQKRAREEPDSTPSISARARAQRARRERENNAKRNNVIEVTPTTILDVNNASIHRPFAPSTTTSAIGYNSSPISARTLSQRARREREKNAMKKKSLEEEVQTIPTVSSTEDIIIEAQEVKENPRDNSLSSSPTTSIVSTRTLSQRARREREKKTRKERPIADQLNESPINDSFPIAPMISARARSQRIRREREKNAIGYRVVNSTRPTTQYQGKRKRCLQLPSSTEQPSQLRRVEIAQRARRQREKGITINSMYDYPSTSLYHPVAASQEKGKKKVVYLGRRSVLVLYHKQLILSVEEAFVNFLETSCCTHRVFLRGQLHLLKFW